MIRLTIIKAPDTGTCTGSDMVFGPGGGTIGRSRNSTWALLDNDFLISRIHAEIYADNGQYFVADKSTNGLFLNHARKALGFGEATPLRNGDQMHLGHYTLAIALEAPKPATSAAELGNADFLDKFPHTEHPSAIEATAIPDNWLQEPGILELAVESAGSSTLVAGRGDDPLSASWFENSLRMMLVPVVGSSISNMPASDLIALVTQLARTAVGSKVMSGSDTNN
jgi:type VI secretion system FHA domain protein